MPRISSTPIVTFLFALLIGACSATPEKPASATTGATQKSSSEGAIALDWEPPTDRVDGRRLSRSEISGYRIYVGDRSGLYSRTIDVKDPRTTNYVVRGLQPGEEYFVAITTIDRDGRESPKSEEISMAAAPLADTQLAESEQSDRPRRSRTQ